MDLATSLTRVGGGQLHVGHAWHLPGELTLRSSSFVHVPNAEVDVMIRATEAEHRARVQALVGSHDGDGLDVKVHIVKGAAGEVLPALADRLSINLVVMGTIGRTGLSGLIMGNTAETLLRSVACSVLAVKPEGFVSPIRPDPPTDVVTV